MNSNIEKQIFAIIDGNAIVHRAYHALPPFTTKEGVLVNAVYGFFSFVFRIIKDLQPGAIAVAFDLAAPTFRHQEFDGYKAKRKKAPDNLYHQIPIIKEILEAMGIKFFTKEGFEADDLLGTMAVSVQKSNDFKTVIISSDTDILQLVGQNIQAIILQRGISQFTIYDDKGVQEKYQGLIPKQLIDFKALRGDPSDNIPGVFGIGEKTAISLINHFGDMENLYSLLNEKETEKVIKKSVLDKLIKQKDQAFMSRNLAEIRTNVPIDFDVRACYWQDYDREKVSNLFRELGFSSLANRLPVNKII
ncbi:hypothetical protein L6250_00535 [Candidatus Parcubacteria bacterium]|nr:hypothetical protein [Patescibacteria group bacterium]MBU4466812.1 hypothetical protein [Patescibacteria group bacterium]MCG2688115.1 hypothetical protein [Candidatus Parcubacteria bacterium]